MRCCVTVVSCGRCSVLGAVVCFLCKGRFFWCRPHQNVVEFCAKWGGAVFSVCACSMMMVVSLAHHSPFIHVSLLRKSRRSILDRKCPVSRRLYPSTLSVVPLYVSLSIAAASTKANRGPPLRDLSGCDYWELAFKNHPNVPPVHRGPGHPGFGSVGGGTLLGVVSGPWARRSTSLQGDSSYGKASPAGPSRCRR